MSVQQALSPEQQAAAYACDGPVCILAGAGSGKTRVITHRIAYLVQEHGAYPGSILGVTFTNKAAREMRERVAYLLPDTANQVLLGTFHSLAARFLRQYGPLVSVPKDFIIYDEDDCNRLIKKIIKENYDFNKEDLNFHLKQVMKLRHEHEISNKLDLDSKNIYEIYQEKISRIGALDFSGLLKKLLLLLKNSESQKLICSRIKHIVVDEYQDVNLIQAQIIYILTSHAQTAAIVGDDDQAIYGWRGASASYMHEFLNKFENTKLYRLEDNYRSTKAILDGANNLISHNQERLGKNLNAVHGEGSLIKVKRFVRDSYEASAVVEQALRLFEKFGSSFEIAVLMRTNAQSRPLEEKLNKARMPYRMVGGMRFYDRKEIKDTIAAVRASLYPQSDVDILRVLENFPMGIGKKTLDKISSYAGINSLSLYNTMSDQDHQQRALGVTRTRDKINNFSNKIKNIRQELIWLDSKNNSNYMRADEALIYIIEKFNIAKRLEQKDDEESEARLENIEQLVQAGVNFVEDAQSIGAESGINNFLEQVALISKDESVRESSSQSVGTVTLMTLHAAKGLEFDAVFLVGLEDGILPHDRSLQIMNEEQQKNSLEEERRLMYVGMTRAKRELILSFCQERFLHGRMNYGIPSRFISEIPTSVIEPSDHWVIQNRAKNTPTIQIREAKAPIRDYEILYEDSELKIGMKVKHKTYLQGTIIELTNAGSMTRAKVRFSQDGLIRTILTSHLAVI